MAARACDLTFFFALPYAHRQVSHPFHLDAHTAKSRHGTSVCDGGIPDGNDWCKKEFYVVSAVEFNAALLIATVHKYGVHADRQLLEHEAPLSIRRSPAFV